MLSAEEDITPAGWVKCACGAISLLLLASATAAGYYTPKEILWKKVFWIVTVPTITAISVCMWKSLDKYLATHTKVEHRQLQVVLTVALIVIPAIFILMRSSEDIVCGMEYQPAKQEYWVRNYSAAIHQLTNDLPFKVTPTGDTIDSLKKAIKAEWEANYDTKMNALMLTIIDPDTQKPVEKQSTPLKAVKRPPTCSTCQGNWFSIPPRFSSLI